MPLLADQMPAAVLRSAAEVVCLFHISPAYIYRRRVGAGVEDEVEDEVGVGAGPAHYPKSPISTAMSNQLEIVLEAPQ